MTRGDSKINHCLPCEVMNRWWLEITNCVLALFGQIQLDARKHLTDTGDVSVVEKLPDSVRFRLSLRDPEIQLVAVCLDLGE